MPRTSFLPEQVEEHQRWLKSLARSLHHNNAEAEDLVQEAWIVALKNPPPQEGMLRAWLSGIVKNLSLMSRRTHLRRVAREAVKMDFDVPSAEQHLLSAEQASALLLELDRLSEPYRSTLLMTYYEEKTSAEVGMAMGVSPETVRKRSQVALSRLRQALNRPATRPERRALLMFGATAKAIRCSLKAWPQWLLRAAPVAVTMAIALTIVVPARSIGSRARDDGAELRVSPHADGCQNLQQRIDATPAYGTLSVPPCVYRESLIVSKPVALLAAPGAEIRGSDVWTRFITTSKGWMSELVLPANDDLLKSCNDSAAPCTGPEQVFVDGKLLQRVGQLTPPSAGQYQIDERRHVILAQNPAGHTVEVSLRARWISVFADDVVIEGFQMRHALGFEHGLEVIQGSRNVHVTPNSLTHTPGTGMAIAGDDHTIEENEIYDLGGEGLVLEPGSGTLVRKNRIFSFGQRNATQAPRGRRGGITGILVSNTIVRGNEVHDGLGTGLFFIGSTGQLEQNFVYQNWGAGIFIDVLDTMVSNNNAVDRNGAIGNSGESNLFVVGPVPLTCKESAHERHASALQTTRWIRHEPQSSN